MLKRILNIPNVLKNRFINWKFNILKNFLKSYNFKFYYKDELNILSKIYPTDNLRFIFETKLSASSLPIIISLDKKVNNLDIALDVGANIGIISTWISRRSKTVYSFEPVLKNRKRFKENIKVNQVKNVKLIPYAISDKIGKMNLYLHESHGHHSLGKVNTSKVIGKKSVKVITLDSFCEKNNIQNIDLLKIDVEGFEKEVLLGANNLLKNKKIKFIIFEISKVVLESLGRKHSEVFDILTDYGFKIYNSDHKEVKRADLKSINHQDLYATLK